MIHQSAIDALYSANYVDNFFDTIENLPDEVQRQITRMRELDIQYQILLQEMESLRAQFAGEGDSLSIKRIMVKFQEKLISTKDIGDEKLQIVQNILDIIDNRQRKLDVNSKNVGKGKMMQGNMLEFDQTEEKQEPSKEYHHNHPQERSNKRPRRSKVDNNNHHHNDSSNDVPTTPVVEKTIVVRNLPTKNSSQKKTTKKKKRKVRNDRDNREDSPNEIPIDPNEPTYCLCEQVSYGEMIGCDNDLCPIEWFHFSCVNLTNKPKGKWFCPKCRGDKPTVMKPRAQFLKELQKYNKEKEEKS